MSHAAISYPQLIRMSRIRVGIAIALIVIMAFSSWYDASIVFVPIAHAQGATTVSLNPAGVAADSYIPGSTISVQVNVTNSQPYAGFEVGLHYNNSILQVSGLDYSGNIFGNDVLLASECADAHDVFGSGNPCNPDLTYDAVGVVSLVLLTNSGYNTPTPNGKLFTVNFSVLNYGFSALHFVKAVLESAPNGSSLPVATTDGYFTNVNCDGTLCLPPIVALSGPQRVIVGIPVTFDGSRSKSQNQNGVITKYFWVWRNGFNIMYQNTTSPTATHTFRNIGQWTVTLTVQDNYGTSAIETLAINVTMDQSRISVSMFFTDPSLNYLHSQDFGSILQPTVDVTIANGIVRNVAPRFILAWVNVTNSGATALQSLKLVLNFQLSGWEISPPWIPSKGAIHVYFANASSLADNPEITQPSTISAPTLDFVQLVVTDFNSTGMGHSLNSGQSILLSVKLSYSPIGTPQSPLTYPRLYNFGSAAIAYTQSGLSGNSASNGTYSGLVALATSKGNVSHSATIV